MPRTEINQGRADVTYSAHDGNLWVLPVTTAGISYCRNAMPPGAQRMGMFYLIGEADAARVILALNSAGLNVEQRAKGAI
jgi:hypothetical protein